MKAARIRRFGPPSVITADDLPRPEAGAGQVLVRVKAAGVGNWDALIRAGKVKLEPPPIILGSELSGIVEAIGDGVSEFEVGDQVYGATSEQWSGAYAEYAVPLARMIAQKPKTLTFIEAASAPVVTVTAWQMLFEYAGLTAGQTVLVELHPSLWTPSERRIRCRSWTRGRGRSGYGGASPTSSRPGRCGWCWTRARRFAGSLVIST